MTQNKIKVGIIGCGFVGGALKTWIEENNAQGTPLGTLLAPLHELNVKFRGVEERI